MSSARRAAEALVSLVVVVLIWELVVRAEWVHPFFVPPPSKVGPQLWVSLTSGRLIKALLETLNHFARGYFLAAAIAIPSGILLGRYSFAYNALSPTINFLRPLPSVAVMPVFILLFGFGKAMITATTAFAAGWLMLLNTIDGVARIHPTAISTARVFGVQRLRFVFHVLIPGAAAQIMIGMKTSMGIALVVTIVTELMVGTAGLGAFIVQAQDALRVPESFAGIIALGLLGNVLLRLADFLQDKFIPWRKAVGS